MSEILNVHSDLEVISLTWTGKEALSKVKFSFIVKDLDLLNIDIFKSIEHIMHTNPIPIIV